MRRFIRYDHLGNVIGEVDENKIISLVRNEKINAEHSLTITTVQVLDKGERIVYEDGRGIWREYVVEGIDQEHASGNKPVGTYYCVWSIQSDLYGVPVSVMPGVQSPVTASTALNAILSTQSRWERGTVTNTKTGGASMYDTTVWAAIGVLVKTWGGELDTTIEVSKTGVITRSVDLYSKQGNQTAKRRFDFGADLSSVVRKYADTPYYCRISPRGKGEQTESGGYGRKITIESVNSGKDYLEYASMVDIAKIPDGESGYIYPTLIVENGDCETPTDLKVWAQSVLESYCAPKVSYEVDVVQAAVEGVDIQGVSLGDAVQIVDRKFGDGLRISGRIIEMSVDELNERSISVKIGDVSDSLASKFASFNSLAAIVSSMNGGTMATVDYLNRLLERINGEINATGGYTYITEGQGLRTYDKAVSDPLVGAEADAVVEVKGGTIRIANSRTSGGDWDWKTVFTSGHIAANLVTAANITAGYIGSAGETFIDLDNSTVQLGSSSDNHMVIDSGGLLIEHSTSLISHLGYGQCTSMSGTVVDGAYYVFGNSSPYSQNQKPGLCSVAESSGKAFGAYSHSEGSSEAHGVGSHAEGIMSSAGNVTYGEDAQNNMAIHAEGAYNTAYGLAAHVEGYECSVTGEAGHAGGRGTKASGAQYAIGKYNKADSYPQLIVGCGASDSARHNCLEVGKNSINMFSSASGYTGTVYVNGSSVHSSDRRLKEHHAYLSDDACEFVRKLKPALFTKDGSKHLGFYAQDVQEADTWDTSTVVEDGYDEDLGFNPLSLDYQALIAPLVAYTQKLEKRIEQLERGGDA